MPLHLPTQEMFKLKLLCRTGLQSLHLNMPCCQNTEGPFALCSPICRAARVALHTLHQKHSYFSPKKAMQYQLHKHHAQSIRYPVTTKALNSIVVEEPYFSTWKMRSIPVLKARSKLYYSKFLQHAFNLFPAVNAVNSGAMEIQDCLLETELYSVIKSSNNRAETRANTSTCNR